MGRFSPQPGLLVRRHSASRSTFLAQGVFVPCLAIRNPPVFLQGQGRQFWATLSLGSTHTRIRPHKALLGHPRYSGGPGLSGRAATDLRASYGSAVSLCRCSVGLAPPLPGSAISCVPATSRQHPYCLRRASSRQDGPLDLARGPTKKSGPAHSMHRRPPPLLLVPGPRYRPQAADVGTGSFYWGCCRMRYGPSTGPEAHLPPQGAAAYCCTAPQQLPLLRGDPVLSGRPQANRRRRPHPADLCCRLCHGSN
ncbi:hypothetical protein NDU88_000232 [Pleurodeles waltl]|uniref:Uncharacterized protein n=1 Tax=Pleurodeles waltl TaxID=8319 RepID=A0AAV7V799_PLEWA|nr:hypothetical protein NDU88_000232 [Pleurodeles waltl]